ncbi:hypothetical protein [Mycobacterium hubeiense]|uniref:hypothetical protein n=1 Tax=Mycobacterium hubeiense TaxID=1867256 RepID=UPI000C7F5A19|nr:hypothetical protein [Mycobacterium sp. QGD 101]
MSDTKRKKSVTAAPGVAAASLVAVATLFLGAGPAQADIDVTATPNPDGVTVVVYSLAPNPPGGLCTYTARPQGNPIGKPLPVTNVPFFLPQGGSQSIPFLSFQTGATWDITVDCPIGGVQYDWVVY